MIVHVPSPATRATPRTVCAAALPSTTISARSVISSPGFPVPVIGSVGLFVTGKTIVGVGGASRSTTTGTATERALGILSGLSNGRTLCTAVQLTVSDVAGTTQSRQFPFASICVICSGAPSRRIRTKAPGSPVPVNQNGAFCGGRGLIVGGASATVAVIIEGNGLIATLELPALSV